MSESVKPRFAVDLNDIERQLAHTQGVPAQPVSASRNDPLAELARIVGQDDPFQTLLANDGAARPRQQASSIDDLFAVGGHAASAPRPVQAQPRAVQADPRVDLGHYPQGNAHGAAPAYPYQPEASAQGQGAYDDGAYAEDYYDEGSARTSQGYGAPEPLDYPPLENRRSRKGLIAIGAILGAVVIGVGGAYVLTGKSALTSSGGPPLIKANNEPTKVQPQNPGGVEIPNQNKQIYERANQTGETKVVNREEQPVDVKQAVRANGSVADATGATVPAGAQGQSAGGLNLGEPRKVRTVSIRPDGTVVRPEAANAPRSGPAPVPAMTLPQAAQAQPAPATPVQVASAQPTPAPAKPAASTPAAAPAAPVQKPVPAAATPASGASPQKVAAVQPAPAAPTPAAATDGGAGGGYAVQLGLANSETAAGTTLAQLQRKYPDLDGAPSLIRKAEVNGNTIYRVRVGPFSKEEASSLCSKVQGQGGQCFVAKN